MALALPLPVAPRPSAHASAWDGPGASLGSRRRFLAGLTWHKLLWSMLYPPRGDRIMPTVSGIILMSLAMGIGTAAYNTANNILFITLSLLLACLILSGLLSWLNLAKVAWRLEVTPPWRAGTSGEVAIELRNAKRLLPTYGLWFDLATSRTAASTRLALRTRLDPGDGTDRLTWVVRPMRRGREHIELLAVGSLFPFGFLRKVMGSQLRREVIVWPAPVEYSRHASSAAARPRSGEAVARLGQSGDLLALRRYAQGDSHRLIHWKASARLRTLMVRQFSRESQDGFSLWLRTDGDRWPRPEQFELLCSFVVTLAEDLFKIDQLATVALNDEPPQPIRRVRDLETFFDQVALLEPTIAVTPRRANATSATSADPNAAAPAARARRNLITFSPDGPRGVAALVDGELTASA